MSDQNKFGSDIGPTKTKYCQVNFLPLTKSELQIHNLHFAIKCTILGRFWHFAFAGARSAGRFRSNRQEVCRAADEYS